MSLCVSNHLETFKTVHVGNLVEFFIAITLDGSEERRAPVCLLVDIDAGMLEETTEAFNILRRLVDRPHERTTVDVAHVHVYICAREQHVHAFARVAHDRVYERCAIVAVTRVDALVERAGRVEEGRVELLELNAEGVDIVALDRRERPSASTRADACSSGDERIDLSSACDIL